ncbi:transcription factor HIVEP2a [Boleophthalmus pectinirostris]|uniref:transcription factor HIVEP2a n=1 Tax=Boleophthalmus pectinirostris TaxID=150288 RepID=UPI000A1C6843|nr:transcription factor HIVEP2a [Boleophthalmus pectinirostris]XP_055005626.1 transcription factor HIVEP2a [Boleophthalmus pectinirostris]XP_055005627.1 transcription factor HIVEP2a [Boleophthalmus pectinirostris]XP_055005628.1 transcription factor HIVEP2a [Boleophthalmus pectinirostris]
MEAQEPASGGGQKCQSKDPVMDKATLQRKWASEPSSTKRSTFADPEAKNRESLPCGATGGSVPRQKYGMMGNTGKMLPGQSPMGESQGPYGQGFPRGYAYQMGQQYPQHPQTEQRFLSGAKPQPGLEPHAWPFAGQLPSDDLFGHPGHTQPHASGAGRFPRQKSPSLPSSFGQYSQSDSLEESHGKKDQKPKKPGKYICHYCGRACAKPSVLKKHIRSHTGERPYPCVPCGFSFKTKSNLYKHRKSHAHAIKAGLVPFSDLAASRAGELDQASPSGEAEVHSDGEQSTDTDEEGVEGATMLMEKGSPVPQISFEAGKNAGGVEPAYADSAEELSMGAMKVPILIVPKPGAVPSPGMEYPPFQDSKTSHHMLGSQAGGRVHSLDDSPNIKKCLALRIKEKKSLDSDPATQSLNLLSPCKGSTDSGYFSRSESAEQQISPPNTNVKTYEEIMFGRTWYYRPNSRSRQSITAVMTGADPNTLANFKQKGAIIDMGKLTEDLCFRGDVGVSGDPKQYLAGPCQSSTGLLEPPSESSHLTRSNSMPTPSPPNLSIPPGIRGSHSVDEMMPPDEVFYPPRILRRQKAFEHSGNEVHVGETMGGKVVGLQGTKVSMSDLATRKRRKVISVGDEDDSPGHCDSSCSGSVEMTVDYEFKSSLDGTRSTPTGKGSFHSQSDSFDTCPSVCSEDIALFNELDGRKAAGNVISVIQHTNSLSRPNSFEKSESFDQQTYQDRPLVSQYSEQSDSEIYEDALSPDSALFRTESMEQQVQSDSDFASHSSPSAAPSPGQPYHIPHKLVRQPNIQVPEIRVTEEPDKPEKDLEIAAFKEPEKTQEEFQLPQRSDTLSQMPSEKLPPKKKRLRLADMEHSSGESSFESTCTSLSRSPSQESNLSHSSSFSMSFDKEEAMKSMSPTKQDDSMASGPKQSEFLTVPGSGHSSHHQQREMRRSSSEQAPCTLPSELPEMRSKSFDYGNLSPSRQGEVYSSASAMKERRRGFLVRQASLSVYPEAVAQESSSEMTIKQEEHGSWSAAPCGDVMRSKRGGSGVGSHPHQQHTQYMLQQSISEDSLQDEPLHVRPQHYRLQTQGSSSEGEHQEVMNKEIMQQYPSGPPFIPFAQQGVYWSQDGGQIPRHQLAIQQLQKLHIRSPGHPTHKHSIHDQPTPDAKVETSQMYSGSFSSRSSPLSQSHYVTKASQSNPTTNSILLQQIQPVFATQNANPQASLPGMLVPVRIHTNVPSFGSVMYTSVSQLLPSQDSAQLIKVTDNIPPPAVSKPPSGGISGGISGTGFNLAHFLGQTDLSALRKSPNLACLNTGIPLSLTSGTISTTDASSSAVGGKRMLSPTSSLELFFQTKHQKRVKEERMYGQIVKEMSAVELSGTESKAKQYNQSSEEVDESERMSQSPPLSDVPPKISIPVRSSAPQPPDLPRAESFTPPLQIVTVRSPKNSGRDSPEELDVDVSNPSPQSMVSNDGEECDSPKKSNAKSPVNMLVQLSNNQNIGQSGQTLQVTDTADAQFFQFPSLRTLSKVSWCFLNYTKPNANPVNEHNSVYSSWCVSSHNPNPLNLSTKAALALLRSKQKRSTDWIFTTAPLSPPSSGKLVSSIAWKLRFDQLKPELMPVDVSKFGKKMKGVVSWDRSKEDQGEKEVSVKPPTVEPTRIKIFEGGYKSNEDYVYVRGRGRGKYICEECGIRCKKPSMLKKHIRTHTDVRPYVCKYCNFAFKTKGNLTKHMKSKAHMKKCLELGVSMSSVEDTEADEGDAVEEGPPSEKRSSLEPHQFSDADDSDGEELDEDEEDEEDDYDGDSTPKTCSRSTSPQPYGLPAMSITSVAPHLSPHPPHPSGSPDILGHSSKPPPSLFGYFTTVPSIQITPQAPHPVDSKEQFQRGTSGNRLLVPPSLDEELSMSSSDLCTPSRLSSPGLDHSGCPSPISPSSSPSARRYLSPHRELSPRSGHLSPRRDVSPLRHIAGTYRRDLSPRRGHLSLLSPLSRPTSPGGSRDFKRDLSPRGRHRGMIRPLSPRRGLQHQHLLHQSQQSGSRSLRAGLQSGLLGQTRANADMETDQLGSSSPDGNRGSPPHQVLFSHLPLHSQLQVRSPFPMIPIGGIQMVHSVPVSATSPLPQHAPNPSATSPRIMSLQKSTSEDSNQGDSTPPPPPHLHGNISPSPQPPQDPARPGESEEGIQTFTDNFSSLCIDSEKNLDEAKSQNTPLHFSQSPTPSPSSESTTGSKEPAS